MRESSLSAKIVKKINSIPGCHAQKMHGNRFAVTGTPDIFACAGGRAFLLEVKTPAGRLQPAQVVELRRWANAGAFIAVVSSMEEAMSVLRQIMQEHPAQSVSLN